MPLIFIGHGSPVNVIEDNTYTKEWKRIGKTLPKPKGILVISAHWYTKGTKVNDQEYPRQVFDMYGFPEEIYTYKYNVKGSPEIAERIIELSNKSVTIDNSWGIDHGSWSVLAHLFPKADVPVVQLSIDRTKKPEDFFEIGKALADLRKEGVLVIASGNIVHNLRSLKWELNTCTKDNQLFDDYVLSKLKVRDFDSLIHYPYSEGVRYPDHYYPLLFILGMIREDDEMDVFSKDCIYGSLSMTNYIFK